VIGVAVHDLISDSYLIPHRALAQQPSAFLSWQQLSPESEKPAGLSHTFKGDLHEQQVST